MENNDKKTIENKEGNCYKLLHVDGEKYRTYYNRKFLLRKPYSPVDEKKITAFIPGTIQKLYVSEGKKVKKGEKLLVLEAMKMRNDLITNVDGVVKKIHVKVGDIVMKNQLLVELV